MHAPAQATQRVSSSTCRPTRAPTQHCRLKVVSLNVGGLRASSYDVMPIGYRARGKQYDVVMLQETHYGLGKHLLEYTLPEWSVVSSPDPMHRNAGVAIVISCEIASADTIQYRAVKPGRILHVRVQYGQGRQARAIDFVSAYQWVWDVEPAKGRLEASKIWDDLSSLVQSEISIVRRDRAWDRAFTRPDRRSLTHMPLGTWSSMQVFVH